MRQRATTKAKPVLQRGISYACDVPGARLKATREVSGEQKSAAWFHHGLVQFTEKLGAVAAVDVSTSSQQQVRAHDLNASVAARPLCLSTC